MATIVDFADLKDALELEKDSFDDYAGFETMADGVHSDLENHVGRKLDVIGNKTETGIIIDKTNIINLKNLPITSITSVTIDGVKLDATEYKINNYGITLTSLHEGAFTIVTKGGFKTIPDEIYRSELSQIVYEFQNKNNLAVTQFTNDGGGTSLPGFVILKHVKEMLASYVHIDKMGY